MRIEFSPQQQQAFLQEAVESGRLQRPEDAAQEPFSLWAEPERSRAGIVAQLDLAEAQLARVQSQHITKDSTQQLAVKQQLPRYWGIVSHLGWIPTSMKFGFTSQGKWQRGDRRPAVLFLTGYF